MPWMKPRWWVKSCYTCVYAILAVLSLRWCSIATQHEAVQSIYPINDACPKVILLASWSASMCSMHILCMQTINLWKFVTHGHVRCRIPLIWRCTPKPVVCLQIIGHTRPLSKSISAVVENSHSATRQMILFHDCATGWAKLTFR